jgi:diaminopimelate epimerase
MTSFNFYKYQGTGNDFIILDGIDQELPHFSTSQIEQLCDRKFGIGADGFMLILPCDDTDFKMKYYNADGEESTMCGNGGRCIAHLAHDLGHCENETNFMAVDGSHHATIDGDNVKLGMSDVEDITVNENLDYILNTGSPHYVHFTKLENMYEIVDYGKSIRFSDTYAKEGINVNLAYWNGNALDVATYERGVEDETLSCGTGVTAAALAFAFQGKTSSPLTINTKGGQLKVHFLKTFNGFDNIILEGPATMVFKGEISI